MAAKNDKGLLEQAPGAVLCKDNLESQVCCLHAQLVKQRNGPKRASDWYARQARDGRRRALRFCAGVAAVPGTGDELLRELASVLVAHDHALLRGFLAGLQEEIEDYAARIEKLYELVAE